MYSFTTTKFVNGDVQPYIPAGTFDLQADPRSFLDFGQRRTNIARYLEALLLSVTSSGDAAGASVNGPHDMASHPFLKVKAANTWPDVTDRINPLKILFAGSKSHLNPNFAPFFHVLY
ncbi:hypothetical protein DL765_000403 [Monosporascus sp. GIB2]|nr:hypothetical protein DL765_000403 [Monosporascus sp. GIB2]